MGPGDPQPAWREAVAGRLRAESRALDSERRVRELSAELDAARAAAAAGALVLAKASHELRTPLNGIIGLAEILRHKAAAGLGAAEAVRLAGDIHESGVHLLNLVDALLDLSRSDVGAQTAPGTIAIRAEIDRALSALGPVAERKGIVVENACEAAIEWTADRRVFRQVAINLASNAVKFSPPGSRVRIGVSLTAEALALHVGDQGPGVAENERERILLPFDRGRAAEREGVEGVGLGLAIVAELLKRQEGRLVIESAEGGGSIFTAVFPAARGPEAQAPA
jgi:signal transduction histidine kinase